MGHIAAGQIRAPVAELYRRHNADVFNFLAWLCRGHVNEAEELTLALWERLMPHATSYQGRGQFRAYLFQMARNLRMDQLRRLSRETSLDDAPDLDTAFDLGPGPAEQLSALQDLAALRERVLRLPDEQREVIILRFHAELSLEEIAIAVERPVETVKSRLRYAYARLRRALRVGTE